MPYGDAAPPPMDGPPPGMDGDTAKPSMSHYARAGRTIRHALADGDDEALGQAICDLIDIHEGDEGHEEPDGDEGGAPKGKPNLALILASKGKGKE